MTYLAVNESFLVLVMGKWDPTSRAAVKLNAIGTFILVVPRKSDR